MTVGGQQFEYRILGTLEVVRDGQPLPIRSRTQRTLLAGLLMRRGRWVPTDRLRELLGEPAPISRNALHLHIKRLRGVLGAADQIVHRNDGYLMPSGSAATDLARFDALVGRASGAARTGDRDTALARLREAGRLWRGPILADVPGHSLHTTEVHPLTERCLAATEERFALELSVGDAEGLVAELTALCARYPMRERLLGQLMQALHRSHRPVDALDALRAYATWLREEFGLDPGPDLRALELAILRGQRPPRPRDAPARGDGGQGCGSSPHRRRAPDAAASRSPMTDDRQPGGVPSTSRKPSEKQRRRDMSKVFRRSGDI